MTQANFDEETIRLTYSIPFKVTKDIRLTILQFKIIHHILPTNATLFRDSLIQHEKCHLCNEKQNLDTPFCNMLFCTNLLDPVCSLVEQKALRLYHPIRTEYNLWIHSRSSSSPWFEPLFNHRQILYLYCVTKRRGLYLGSFFCYT